MSDTLGNILGVALILAIPVGVLIFWIVAVILKAKRLKKNRKFVKNQSEKLNKVIELQQEQINELKKQNKK